MSLIISLFDSRNLNIIFNFLAQLINILLLFFILPLLQQKFGEFNYGKLVIFHTTFLILFQFNHVYTTFLKMISSKSGKYFLQTLFNYIILIALIFFGIFFFTDNLICGFIFLILSTLNAFNIQSILVKRNLNSLSSYIVPILNLFLLIGLLSADEISIKIFLIKLSYGYLFLNAITFTLIGFNFNKFKLLKSRRKWFFLFKRTFQTSTFSIVTIAQTNADKYIIPLVYSLEILGIYHLIILIPSRISSIYGNITLAFSKDVHDTSNISYENYLKQFLTYASILSVIAIFIVSAFAKNILEYSFFNKIDSSFYYVFFLSILISLIQSIGFFAFPIFSRLNKLNSSALVNLLSLIIFIFLLFIFKNIGDPLIIIVICLFVSKISEFINAFLISKFTKLSVISTWLKYFIIPILLILIFLFKSTF
ncbi:MAG: hypothetical protein CBC40_04500 [bacterium TMED80]|nr:MAG: hypothetical protein CBC40_04500 [bacterium TMED80]|tara:strand:+ start:3333 stop:4601 length:1269 start_codon:yes stop_codon:yes gene_type:complete